MHVVATAGHVDHGKSTLVRLLTGRDPDRLAEERRRGLTLDLGFAWTSLPGGEVLALVDVPGHQRFVPTMLAGVGPVPAVMFVVAADEGWCAQSTEHLAALDALQVRYGLLVVTKSDLADPRPARDTALARLADTTLGRLPAVTVSGRTGYGLDELRDALTGLVQGLPPADRDADARLWVDRAFTVRGGGTVVTGTLAAGTVHRGDEIRLFTRAAPEPVPSRVRRLESLECELDTAPAIARVAVNLRGVERVAVRRGDALVDAGAGWRATSAVDVALRGDPATELPGRLMLHVGTAAVGVRLRPLGDRSGRLLLDRALPLRFGDRGLLREPGRHHVAAGALVLDVIPRQLHRRGAARALADELARIGDARAPATSAAVRQLARAGFVHAGEFRGQGLPPTGQEVTPGWWADGDRWRELLRETPRAYDRWHRDHPVSAGVPVEVLRQRLAVPDTAVVGALIAAAGLIQRDGLVIRPGDGSALPAEVDRAVGVVEADLAAAPFVAPDADRLAALGLGRRELAAAARAGRLRRVTDRVVLAPDAPRRALDILAGLPQPFTLSQARQALGTTRRVAVPLLELLDHEGATRRLPDGTHQVAGGVQGPEEPAAEEP